MRRRLASINDLAIEEEVRRCHRPLDRWPGEPSGTERDSDCNCLMGAADAAPREIEIAGQRRRK